MNDQVAAGKRLVARWQANDNGAGRRRDSSLDNDGDPRAASQQFGGSRGDSFQR